MTRTRTLTFLLAASIAAFPFAVVADTSCPAAVSAAAKKAFPDAALIKCVAEESSFEVVMQRKDKTKVELDISTKGEIEQIEENVPVATIPSAVAKAFAARYPKSSILKAEKQSKSDKTVTFEVAFKVEKTLKEATFKDDGTFVEEE